MGKGKSDLSLRRIHEIRGYSGRYGNCSHGNHGIVQMIWQEAVVIWRYFTIWDFLVNPSAAPCNGNIADGRIKGGYLFGRIRYFTIQGVLVSPSAVLCNGNIADGQLKWRCPFEGWGFRGIWRGTRPGLFRLRLSVTKLRELIAERHHYCREFWGINDFILRNWGVCVDTIFGHVSRTGRV